MKYPRKWENITEDKDAGCARLKVPGGWLVVAWVEIIQMSSERLPENLLFISDPKHEWELEDK